MAASVGNSESAGLDAKIRAGGEDIQVCVKVSEASSEKPNLCSDNKCTGDGESCGKIAGPAPNDTTPKMTEAGGNQKRDNIESPDKKIEVSKTQVMDGDIQKRFQAGDISENELQAGHDIPKQELQGGHDISKQKLQTSNDILKQELQTGHDIAKQKLQTNHDISKHLQDGHDIPKQEHQAGHDIPKQEHQAGHDISKQEIKASADIAKHELQTGHDIPKQKLQAGHDIPKQKLQAGYDITKQELQVGHDIPKQKLQAGYDITKQELQVGHDIPKQKLQAGYDITKQELQVGHEIPKQKLQAGYDITKQELQAGHDIPKQKLQAGYDITKQELQVGHEIPKQKLQAGYDITKQELQAGHDIPKQKLQAGYDITKQELQVGHDIPKQKLQAGYDSPKQEIKSGADILKQELQTGHDIPKQELQTGHDIPKQELQTGHDIPKQELQTGHDIPKQELQTGHDIPKQELQAGGDIPNHDLQANADIPKLELQAGGDILELGNDSHKLQQATSVESSDVFSCASSSEKVLPERAIAPLFKDAVVTDLNHMDAAAVDTVKTTSNYSEDQFSKRSTLTSKNTVDDNAIKNKNDTLDSKLLVMKSTPNEKSDLTLENRFAGNEQDNNILDRKLPEKEYVHKVPECTPEKGFGDGVNEYENITKYLKSPEMASAQKEKINLTSEISVSDSTAGSKAHDQLPEIKVAEEKGQRMAEARFNENITENLNRSQDSILLNEKHSHEKITLTSEVSCTDNVSENDEKDQGSKLPVKTYVEEHSKIDVSRNEIKTTDNKPLEVKSTQEKSIFDISSAANVTDNENKATDNKLSEVKSTQEKSDVSSESTCTESVIESGNKIENSKFPETKLVEDYSVSTISYVDKSKPSDSNSPEMKTTQERSELASEISFDENIHDNELKLQLSSYQENFSLTFSEFEPASNSTIEDQEKDPAAERPVREMLVRRKYSESSETVSDKPVLETLTFSSNKIAQASNDEEPKAESSTDVCVCLLCDRSYPADNKDILAHLVLMHKFVIADVNFIASLPAYLRYWKARFQEKPISEFCSKIVTNTGAQDQAPKEEFYLLCDALPEDKSIREHLQRKKLESVLAQQQKEREETKFCRQCLFCKQTFCGNRAVLFDHLLRDHTFHMGQPDNLVYTDELFDLIQSKLDNQLCLFCEKSFKDKASLREHMRKKQHRKINPKNKEYDRFYIVNYMEMGKNWESLQSEDNRLIKSSEKETDEEEEWSGWNEESESKVVCLFCDSSCVVQTDLQQHMKERHSFDLQEVNNKLQLNFYQKVKLINYIRRQVYHKTCYGCLQTYEDKDKLLAHFDEFSDHIKKIPDAEVWDQPQYFFPTYEDDCLLCHLDDDDEGAAGDALGVMVIAETIPVTDTILEDQKLCRDLLKP